MDSTRQAVLEAIAAGPVSGPALAEELDISRAAVWKHVEQLRAEGFHIESTDAGYTLKTIPEFGGHAVALNLPAPFDIEYHESITSTNDRARELAATGATDVVVLANEQTSGRGRKDREWHSPPGGIWLSVLVRPSLSPTEAPVLTLAAAVAVAEAMDFWDIDVQLKWPNDVLTATDERKLAGILTEMAGETDAVSWVSIGVGVNANIEDTTLPATATSMQAICGEITRRKFVHRFLSAFDTYRTAPEQTLNAWRNRSGTIGRVVRIHSGEDVIEGEAVGIESPGHLLIETETGTRRVHAGDCEHLRPIEN